MNNNTFAAFMDADPWRMTWEQIAHLSKTCDHYRRMVDSVRFKALDAKLQIALRAKEGKR